MTLRWVVGGLLVLACGALGRMGPAGESLWPFQIVFGAAFLAYAFAVWSVRHEAAPSGPSAPSAPSGPSAPSEPSGSRDRTGSSRNLWILLGFAVAMRAAIFAMPASDDVYRYLWEGRAQGYGVSPYETAPLDAASYIDADLSDDPFLHRLNHPNLTTIYPPLAELWFRLVAWIRYTESAWKVSLLLAEAFLIWGLVRLLRGEGQCAERVLIYAWNPLVLTSFAGEGHLDVLMLGCLVWALVWSSRAPVRAGIAFGAAVAFKLVVGVLALVFVLPGGRRDRAGKRSFAFAGRFALAALAVCAMATLPFLQTARGLWSILVHFGVEMRHNGSIHAGLAALLPAEDAALATAAGFLVAAVVLTWRLRDPYSLALALLGAFLLFSPAVHPWYVTWLLPLLALRLRWPWLVWSASVGGAYAAYGIRAQTGVFELSGAWTLWIYAPVYTGLLLARARGRAVGGSAPKPGSPGDAVSLTPPSR